IARTVAWSMAADATRKARAWAKAPKNRRSEQRARTSREIVCFIVTLHHAEACRHDDVRGARNRQGRTGIDRLCAPETRGGTGGQSFCPGRRQKLRENRGSELLARETAEALTPTATPRQQTPTATVR